ncbi:MAG TPA: malic enzyme-like NAD(P)-binding protein, partial [bacterium]|nr:malic enzyme-like NAD(P)-binding protein [bacterium]
SYEVIMRVRPDALAGTGRSDYPNQVNNVLGFPAIFRGALDVRASAITDGMKVAASKALARIARLPVPEEVLGAYGLKELSFGPHYLIPKPFDLRVLVEEVCAVAEAAVAEGVSRVADFDAATYRRSLEERFLTEG